MGVSLRLSEVEIFYEESQKSLFYHQEIPLATEGYTVLTGVSGSGKSSLLHSIAGLIPLKKGEILGVTPEKTAMLFQENRLFPWRRVGQQISDVLPKKNKNPKAFLEAVGLLAEEKDFPDSLSGGMARRLALARTLAFGTANGVDLYLLDEPFTGIDKERIDLLLEMIQALPVPVLLASHLPQVWENAAQIVELKAETITSTYNHKKRGDRL